MLINSHWLLGNLYSTCGCHNYYPLSCQVFFFIVQPIGKKFDSPEVNYNQFSVLFLKTVTYLWSGLKDFIGDVLILFLYNTVSPVQGKTGMDI